MKLGIMQPYFLPYIGYWQLMNQVDKYIIYDDVNFIKNGWINRNRILINGEAKMITIPLSGASPYQLINAVELSADKVKRVKLLKTIENAYSKAPYYHEVYPLIKEILLNEELRLSRFLQRSISVIHAYLDMQTELLLSSELKKDDNLSGQDKILHICSNLKADEYYNAIGGMELYSFEKFKQQNIKLKFLKAEIVEYKQKQNVFVPGLSIIDVLMFNSKEECKGLLNSFTLIAEE